MALQLSNVRAAGNPENFSQSRECLSVTAMVGKVPIKNCEKIDFYPHDHIKFNFIGPHVEPIDTKKF